MAHFRRSSPGRVYHRPQLPGAQRKFFEPVPPLAALFSGSPNPACGCTRNESSHRELIAHFDGAWPLDFALPALDALVVGTEHWSNGFRPAGRDRVGGLGRCSGLLTTDGFCVYCAVSVRIT